MFPTVICYFGGKINIPYIMTSLAFCSNWCSEEGNEGVKKCEKRHRCSVKAFRLVLYLESVNMLNVHRL